MNSYHIMYADSLEVNWHEFVGDGNVFVFANPPFTNTRTGILATDTTCIDSIQKDQLKRYGLTDHIDIAFLCKSSEEGFDNGLWIVNANSPYKHIKTLNGLSMHIEISDAKTGKEIISTGSQPERWLTVTPGTTEIIDIFDKKISRKMFTGWAKFCCASTSHKVHTFDFQVPGSVEVSYYSWASKGKRCWATNPVVLPEGHTYYNMGDLYINPTLRLFKAPGNYFAGGPRILIDPPEWTLKAITSNVFKVWVATTEHTTGQGGLCATDRSLLSFPLYEGDDLSFFDGMSDDAIREELLKRYNDLLH